MTWQSRPMALTSLPGAIMVRSIFLTRIRRLLWDYDMGTDTHSIAISDNGRVIVVGCDNHGVYYLTSQQGESWSYGYWKAPRRGRPHPGRLIRRSRAA